MHLQYFPLILVLIVGLLIVFFTCSTKKREDMSGFGVVSGLSFHNRHPIYSQRANAWIIPHRVIF